MSIVTVKAEWDPEERVWVATSEDVLGLATEADTLEELADKLQVMVPELLELNGSLDESEALDVPIELLARLHGHQRNAA